MLAVPVPHPGGGSGGLIHLLVRLVAVHALFRLMRGFLIRYTHVPWLASIVVIVLIVVLVRILVRAWQRRR